MRTQPVVATVLVSLVFAFADGVRAQTVFRSTQSANLPTASMIRSGNLLFEISHRFDTPIDREALWGLDGAVRLRLGLTYGVHERLMLGVLRSNFQDNLELNAKFRGFALDFESVPVEVAAQGGIAWNTQVFPEQGAEDNEMQAYVQLMVNALLADRVAIGVVPTFLRNPRILDVDSESAFALGLHGQVYTDGALSVLGEWIFSEEVPDFVDGSTMLKDGGTFGIEIRTRGHFFKIVVTNQSRMNPTQFLPGTANEFQPDMWRLGFNIQRLIPL
jgi:hypothetical protein